MNVAARRTTKAATLTLVALIGALLILLSSPARAEYGDVITSYDIDYVVDPGGDVQVTETIDYAFASYGRHGIYRDLLVRARYDDTQDRLYEISGMEISSPTGAPTSSVVNEKWTDDRRTKYLSYRIGSASQTADQTETYVLKYTIKGALNPQEGADTEFYWNATGNNWDAEIGKVSISVQVPGGPTQVACWAGPANSSNTCDQASTNGDRAEFAQSTVSGGEEWGVTIDVGIDRSKVTADPIIEDRPTYLNQNGFTPINAGIGGGALAALAGYGLYLRREGRDRRFVGVPPGVVPDAAQLKARGNGVTTVPDDGSITAPVAFSPPRGVSPAEASYLRRPGADPDQLSSTILDLAQRGAIAVVGDDDAGASGSRSLQLVDASKAIYPHERELLDDIFHGEHELVSLSNDMAPGVEPPLHQAHRDLRRALSRMVAARKWFTRELGGTRTRLRGLGTLLLGGGGALLVYSAFKYSTEGTGTGVGVWALVAIVGGILLLTISRTGRGQGRTAVGRAVMDQIDGFELYLRTAEADQLRFEEGEDIFSKYLPWAVVFDVAERWTRLCSTLIEQGRIPAQPGWYYGAWDPFHSYIWISSFNNHVGSAAAPAAPVPSASSSGISGGSGFSGGGFSGGGGGGGGGGSW